MGFLTCPGCGNINRDSDTNCFSCQADLTAVPPPPPAPVAEPVQEVEAEPAMGMTRIGGPVTDAPRFKDLASRYVTKPVPKMDSTAVHGLRSGIFGGILVGAAMGAFRTQVPDDLTRLLIRKYPTMPKNGFDIWFYTFFGDILFGLVLGAILGFINQLCWQPESGRTGAILGTLVAGIIYYMSGHTGEPATILIGAVHGWVLAFTISGIERKVFRGL